jgi:hypothetical protein
VPRFRGTGVQERDQRLIQQVVCGLLADSSGEVSSLAMDAAEALCQERGPAVVRELEAMGVRPGLLGQLRDRVGRGSSENNPNDANTERARRAAPPAVKTEREGEWLLVVAKAAAADG